MTDTPQNQKATANRLTRAHRNVNVFEHPQIVQPTSASLRQLRREQSYGVSEDSYRLSPLEKSPSSLRLNLSDIFLPDLKSHDRKDVPQATIGQGREKTWTDWFKAETWTPTLSRDPDLAVLVDERKNKTPLPQRIELGLRKAKKLVLDLFAIGTAPSLFTGMGRAAALEAMSADAAVVEASGLIRKEIELLDEISKASTSALDYNTYLRQLPKATLRYTDAVATNPSHGNFLRFNLEWAQSESALIRGRRLSSDAAARRVARKWADATGLNRDGLHASHSVDSLANRYLSGESSIGTTYYFANSKVNTSFGSQLMHELNRLGVREGEAFWIEFVDFPSYKLHPPFAPPSSPPNLR